MRKASARSTPEDIPLRNGRCNISGNGEGLYRLLVLFGRWLQDTYG